MIFQLDPRIPRVWRTPTALQFGVDRCLLVLTDVTSAEERILSDLEHGITREGLSALADGARRAVDIDSLLARLRPVLRPSAPPSAAPARRRVALDGAGPTAHRIARILESCGYPVTSDIADVDRVEAAVIVGHFAVVPERHGRWLRRDIPHVAVVFGDRDVTIGPLVEPGGPCLACLERERMDCEPAWAALATQLSARTSALETELVSTAVSALASRMVLARLTHGSRRFAAASIRYDGATGTTDVVEVLHHAECGCRALPGIETADEDLAAGRLRPS